MLTYFRPLSPHLPIYKPQLTSTFPISHRISGAFLATMVLFSPILCPKMSLICLTYENFYQSSYISSKFIPSSLGLTILAFSFHLYYGARHLVTEIRRKRFDYYRKLSDFDSSRKNGFIAVFLVWVSFDSFLFCFLIWTLNPSFRRLYATMVSRLAQLISI